MEFKSFLVQRVGRFISDKNLIRIKFFRSFKRLPNFKNPKTFNEKLQWLKLYDRNPEYTVMVDKVAVKEYVSRLVGEEYIIPTLGVWNNAEDIDFDALPDKFVIKCNHNSGDGMYICKDKSKMNVEEVREGLKKGLEQDYFMCHREWPYKNVPRKIIAEQYIEDGSGKDLNDYKIFNFNGEPHIIQVDFDRFTDHKKNLYTTDWELCDFSFNYPSHPEITIPRPEALDEMLRISRILAKDIPYVRTDFYSVNGKIYFGEITFFPASGYGKFSPEKYDELFGEMIPLPAKKKK